MPVTHPNERVCSHGSTLSVISEGLERVVCETCGLVTTRFESFIDGDVQRSKFSRDADRLAQAKHNRVIRAWSPSS